MLLSPYIFVIKVKMLLRILFLFLISISSAVPSEVCSILSICDDISVIRSQVAAIREEQARQANILEGSALPLESASGLNVATTKNNDEFCTLLSICNNLAALSLELADVRRSKNARQICWRNPVKLKLLPIPLIVTKVACDQEIDGGGWTIILRRTDGSEDFFREWKDYEEGFGQVDGEHFVGLARLHTLTSSFRQELLVIIEDNENPGERYALYDNFRVGGEANNYTLESVGNYSGIAGEALKYHEGMQFSTKDRDNDRAIDFNCAEEFEGAWWYNNCFISNLAGLYDHQFFLGAFRWNGLNFNKPVKTAIMMIRPKI